MQQLTVVDSFHGDYEMFSNFYPVNIQYESIDYPTVEHAFVAAKSMDMLFRRRISQIPEDEAGKAKRKGRNKSECKLRYNWDLMKVSVMKNLLIQKFSYNEFKSLLLSTEQQELIEGNYWHDNFWGDCYCKKCTSIIGKNMLGKLLMEVRDEVV